MGEWGEQRNGREMGSAVTYTYSPELQTDSGQILRIRGARLELIANVWPGTWILGWMFVSGHRVSPALSRQNELSRQSGTYVGPDAPKTSIVSADNRTAVINHGTWSPLKKKKSGKSNFEWWKTFADKYIRLACTDTWGGLIATTRDFTVRK